MGVRIISDYKHSVMYCSTSEVAFGPVFRDDEEHDADERVESFLRWLKTDPRPFTDAELLQKYSEWLTQEKSQWAAELKALEELENETKD